MGFQLATTHWFYLYLAWVVPFVFVAIFAPWRTGELPVVRVTDRRATDEQPVPAPALSAP